MKNPSKKGLKAKLLRAWISSVFIFVVVYFLIASVLIVTGNADKQLRQEDGLEFNELNFDYSGLPRLQSFKARNGAKLSFRYYASESDKVLILLHGSGYHSRYLLPLAGFISKENLANVYTPDLRGHGKSPVRRGDIDYIGQFEDDIADLLKLIKSRHPEADLILGGHSSGGGLAIRFAGSPHGRQIDAYLLLSPFLKYNAPTMRPYSGGWAHPSTGRIIGLEMLNNVGIGAFNHIKVIHFNMPEEARDGTETLSYSYRLNKSYAPENYKKNLAAISQPLLVAVGSADKAFKADEFEPAISPYTDVEVKLLKGVSHMGIVVGKEIRPVIENWLENLPLQ
jgi:alpha-beta hydrolase superfamily lysophospholipase